MKRQPINSRREYELYVKYVLKNRHTMTNKAKSAMMKLCLQCFDEGIKFNMGKLEVDI